MPPVAVRVNRKAADRIRNGHPWIFRSDVTDTGEASAGDLVSVLDASGKPLGIAHYSSASQITLRLLTRAASFDLAAALDRAATYRERYVRNTDAYRLVHAEGDMLPGLIIDRYRDVFVMQTLDQGMDRLLDEVADYLLHHFSARAIVARNDSASRALEALPREKRIVRGSLEGEIEIEMNGLNLTVDPMGGQKTGIYLDQRENYAAIAAYARGSTALDCFTSTGGFALHLARTSERVEAVDSSSVALDTARANAARNGLENIEWREADAFEFLSAASSARRIFDLVVLDPPAFAKSRKQVEGAMRGYRDINLRALRLLAPGGILVSCSCSHHVSEADLLEVIAGASLDAVRTLRVVERRSQAGDHPVLLTVPETHYLKCLVFEVV